MFWKQIQDLPDKRFKRLTGVKKDVFHQMKQVVNEHQEKHRRHPTRGKPPKLGVEDKLLVMLMYYREYRTYEHIGITYGISESSVCEIVQTMENILIADKRFHLPGKKKLLEAASEIEVVLIDVAETPVERPKKNSGSITAAKRKNTH
jgi:hypothetical protein